MVAVGAGAEDRIDRTIVSIGSDLLVVANGSRTASGRHGGHGSLLSLTDTDADALARRFRAGSSASN